MTHRIAIVGTGTGVGKSVVTVGWTQHLRGRGLAAAAWKPIETGGSSDAEALVAASGGGGRGATLTFPVPASPHRSARLAGRAIDFQERRLTCDRLSGALDALLVEGAGGAFSPVVDAGRTNVELMVALGVTASVLVATDRLGALHDVLVVLRAAPASLSIRAVVLNSFGSGPEVAALENASELRALLPALLIVGGSHLSTDDYAALTDACFT